MAHLQVPKTGILCVESGALAETLGLIANRCAWDLPKTKNKSASFQLLI